MKKHQAWSEFFLPVLMKKTGLLILTVMAILLSPFVVQADFGDEIKTLDTGTILNSSMGWVVAIDGDRAIAGDTYSRGSVMFVERDAAGAWSTVYTRSAASVRFGQTLAINGDYAVISAQQGDDVDLSLTDSGYVNVYVRDTGTGAWSLQQKLTASDAATSDYFGSGVTISGDTIIVGARGGNAAYVYVVDAGGVWTEQAKLGSSSPAISSLGWSAALDGDRAIIGAAANGAACVFERTGTTWTEKNLLTGSSSPTSDYFSGLVDVSGDYAVIGTNYGRKAYIFERDATGTWAEKQLLACTATSCSEFGAAVTIDGNTAVVGAPWDAGTGSVFSWVRDAGSGDWIEQTKLLASDAAAGDNFGFALSMSGDTLMVGAPDVGTNNTGAVYMYTAAGVVVDTPNIEVIDAITPTTDLQVPFGNVTTGTTADQTITINNIGSADLVLGTVAVANPLAAPFSLLNDNCSSQTLIPTASCTFDVRFAPMTAGAATDSLDIPSNDLNENPVTVSVSGTGVVTTVPDITVSTLVHDFGSATVGSISDTIVTVTNDGNADLIIGNLATADPLALPFSTLNDNCSVQTLTPGANCTFDLRFAPTVAVTDTDSFDIPSNDPDENPTTVNVSGTGTALPVANINVTPVSMNFPPTTVGVVLAPQGFTIANDGTADLNLSNIALGGADAAEFVLDLTAGATPCGTPPAVVTPANNCTGTVAFAPTVAAVAIGTLQITSDDPDTPNVTVALSGAGLVPGANNPPSESTLVSPADGSQVDASLPFEFLWRYSIDPDGDAVYYEFFLCTDADPLANCAAAQVANLNSTGTTDVAFASFLPAAGFTSWSLGAISLAGVLGVLVTIGMARRGRKGMRMLTFLLFTGVLLVIYSCSSNFDGVTHTVTGLSSGTTYSWAVVASDGLGGETPSAVWTFTTQ